MKLFGLYLVEKGLIDNHDLLTSLMEQSKSTPTPSEVVFEGNLLSEEDQLKALDFQSQEHVEYRTACKNLGLWTEELEFKIKEAMFKTRQPLGQILLNNDIVEMTDLTAALDDFMVEYEDEIKEANERIANGGTPTGKTVTNEQESAQAVETPSEPSVETSSESATAEPVEDSGDNSPNDTVSEIKSSNEFNFEFVKFETSLLDEFLSVMSEDKHSRFELMLDIMESMEGDQVSTSMQDILQEFSSIKSAAHFVRAQAVEKIFDSISIPLESMIENCDSLSSDLIGKNMKIIHEAINLAWELKDRIEIDQTEQVFWENDEHRNRFSSSIAALTNAKDEISQKSAA
mgnify:CR=1 FL=1|jgi:hypothetical protein